MTRVKICGLKEKEHALAAAASGAHFLGMIFAESRRQITPEKGGDIVLAIKKLPDSPLTVGVFANLPASDVNQIASDLYLDLVQLSGDETWEYCRDIAKPVIKVVHVSRFKTAGEILSHLELGYRILGGKPVTFLLDSGGGGAYGGTGETFDWGVAGEVARHFRVMLAGGLTSQNVAEAIKVARPWGVDVSSGVETDGRKSSLKIRAFVQAVGEVDRFLAETSERTPHKEA